MPQVVKWEEISNQFDGGSLVLGNGASMAVSDNFGYSSLFEKAAELGYLTAPVQRVFDSFGVNDFELVLRRLWQAKQVNEALRIEVDVVDESYRQVRTALIATIRDVHVSYQDAEAHLEHIFEFMKPFSKVVSLNYDLIVYWAAMYGNNHLGNSWFKDCFNGERIFAGWHGRDGTLFFYPHGNLVLHRDEFSGAKKITARGMNNLLESILAKWVQRDLAPAFVCEGTEKSKQESIASCDYLEQVFYEVLPSLESHLVIFGWSMAEQDDHLLKQIAKSCPVKVAVSVYNNNDVFMGRAEKKLTDIGVKEIVFFDCESAGAWNQPSTEFVVAKKVRMMLSKR